MAAVVNQSPLFGVVKELTTAWADFTVAARDGPSQLLLMLDGWRVVVAWNPFMVDSSHVCKKRDAHILLNSFRQAGPSFKTQFTSLFAKLQIPKLQR